MGHEQLTPGLLQTSCLSGAQNISIINPHKTISNQYQYSGIPGNMMQQSYNKSKRVFFFFLSVSRINQAAISSHFLIDEK